MTKTINISSIFSFIKKALNSEHQDFTTGSIRRSVFLLAIPMILEMCMESVFAVVDIFFVNKLTDNPSLATGTVVLTESMITIVYSVAIGLSMAATAMVARRVGEKNIAGAARAGAQAILLSVFISIIISIAGLFFADDILRLMGATEEIVAYGKVYAQIMFTGNVVIMLLFLLNGIFRGAGDASIAMKSLWIANLFNIILCPVCIHFLGLKGAAIATTIGRGIGVMYQLYNLQKGKGIIKLHAKDFVPDPVVMKALLNVAGTATMQFIVASASWIAMARIMASFGNNDSIAGYGIAIRIIVFFIMPAWGLSNAAATLVGQNLGAGQPLRAEQSVWKVAKYNAIFMGCVSVFFLFGADFFVGIINTNPTVMKTAVSALRIISLGYIFYGVGMVMMNAFNGAGDSKTPTLINIFWFWLIQIPIAYYVAVVCKVGEIGVFLAIVFTETAVTITSVIIFKRGKWKLVKI